MKVLFLGGIFDKDLENEILHKSKSTVHYAANKLQWNLIDGLLKLDYIKLQLLSAPLIGSFPRDYKDVIIREKETTYNGVATCKFVKFSNIWGYRNISRKNHLIKAIKLFAAENEKNKVIIVYSPHTPFLQAAVYAKKKDPSTHISLIVPDLPQFMNLNNKRTLIYDLLKKYDVEVFNRNSRYVDSFVLLTDQMKEILNVGKRPYIVLEGVVNLEHLSEKLEEEDNQKYIVYTGTLNEKFGVVNLIKAFHKLEMQDIRLKICGRGDSEDIIREYACKDSRIDFLGQLSNDEAVELQNRAAILVNPRQNNEEFTKYSFPSKNMEYLLTGKPVIAYKLDGIPPEYDNFFFYVENDTIEALTNTMERVLSMTEEERSAFGKKGREFVLKEKNNYSASRKIIEMIQRYRSR
ncbi:MAG: glycosyltransferase family 4 protein [Clostridiaceae bacterium]|nr:glycosyltransferase family 4 protein [Clostridiaceae bacterium]